MDVIVIRGMEMQIKGAVKAGVIPRIWNADQVLAVLLEYRADVKAFFKQYTRGENTFDAYDVAMYLGE